MRLYKKFQIQSPIIQPLTSKMVAGGGVEPPTRGFSVLCSTAELPGQD